MSEGLKIPCGCEWTPGIDLPTSECDKHALDETVVHQSPRGVPVELRLERGQVNEWGRQRCTLLMGDTPITTLWLLKDWSDGLVAKRLLTGKGPV